MEQVLPFLEGIFLIATTDGDQPHLRPFDAAGILDGKLYIGTKNNNDALGALRIQAEAYPAAAEINQAAYESTQKDYTGETCAAIELKNVHGTISNKLGETIDVNF